jgi:hypothetical protein
VVGALWVLQRAADVLDGDAQLLGGGLWRQLVEEQELVKGGKVGVAAWQGEPGDAVGRGAPVHRLVDAGGFECQGGVVVQRVA